MKLIFAGTPEFASVALARLLAAGFQVPLVLTQPDRPAGRGMKLQASAVKQLALAHHIAVAQPRSLRLDGKYPDEAAAAREAIEAAQADVMVVAAYGLILPQWVLDAMSTAGPPQGAQAPLGGSAPRAAGSVGARPLGCLNIHASLLPRWRGAAPIHRAIEAGDAETGVTIMQMDAGLDTGDMLLMERLPIRADDTTGSLHDRLAVLGGRLIVEALEIAACGGLTAQKQPTEGVTYAHKIDKAEAALDWSQDAATLARRVRAFNPFPGAATARAGEAVKVWAAQAVDGEAGAVPGQVLSAGDAGIRVQTASGALVLTELQRAGGKRLAAADFLRGFELHTGDVFDAAPAQKAPA
ncbi:methionyl-tRNA formyltransferase [Hydrogenophaga sp.]|uniref:methionyl-tRNA formyltransferase n=1 Tax=Hydrogenophaga sp. TaxID=1904254 RepID=UPI0027318D84|nr:methionyl-tRNA formyltransferase [Hydrogenophaga sp.]MDP1687364.1 methionyl-tRNA formyltransferase [Hydrogenophaga sp.]